MRFLIDEMFSAAVAGHLRDLGHDARQVGDPGPAGRTDLAGRTDDEVFAAATVEDRVVVTENAVDFVLLLEAAASAGGLTPPSCWSSSAPCRRTPAPWRTAEWLELCHEAGQGKPTPILLRYRAGDWNAPSASSTAAAEAFPRRCPRGMVQQASVDSALA